MNMPKPDFRIAELAERLSCLSAAIAALRPITLAPLPTQPPIPPGMKLDEGTRTGNAANALRELYLDAREEFEKLRADFEHQFMTWHSELVGAADMRFTGDGLTGQIVGNKKEPEWAAIPPEDELTQLLAQAADKAV